MGGQAGPGHDCKLRILSVLDLVGGKEAPELAGAMFGIAAAREKLVDVVLHLSAAATLRICHVTMAGFGADERRNLIIAFKVIDELDAKNAVAGSAAALPRLPLSEIRFRLAQRVQRIVGPNFTSPVPDRSEADPLVIGASVGGMDNTSGSITCFVRDDSGREMLLTCHHVLRATPVAETDPGYRSSRQDAVYQPARQYKGFPVGEYVRGIRSTAVDAAVATVRRRVTNSTREGTRVQRVASVVKVGDPVWIRGAGSRLQRGIVGSPATSGFNVDHKSYMTGQIFLSLRSPVEFAAAPKLHADDHGAPLLDARNNLVGIVVGSSDDGGIYATPINRVFEELGIELIGY